MEVNLLVIDLWTDDLRWIGQRMSQHKVVGCFRVRGPVVRGRYSSRNSGSVVAIKFDVVLC